ncbi:hypothetical protein [Lysinibacillus sp. LZ02]|uniref:hypothetical protein n=1 Tax=Lysinibacillus sp. LZ02 TaxID=3420668 RepID=UPI003D359B82
MPHKSENQHVEATRHADGKRENIINDPLATASSKIGVQLNSKVEFGKEKNPFDYTPKVDPKMKRFEQLMQGTEKE